MKKIFCLILLSMCLVSAFSQNTVPLEKGLAEIVKYLEERIPKGTKLAVLSLRSQSPQLSEYVMEELTIHFVDRNYFTIVERSLLELVQQELNFQLSGEVSDETAQSIGRKLGAQSIVYGSIEQVGDIYRLRVRVIAVESGAIQGGRAVNIQRDRILTSLSGTASQNSQQSPQGSSSTSSQSGDGGSGSRVSLPDYLLN
jgi:TolB-like protein